MVVKHNIKNKRIHIHLDYNGILKVTDHATGLTGMSMKECFLQVGNYTSQENNITNLSDEI